MIEKRKFIRLRAPIGIVYRLIKKYKRQRPIASLVQNIGGGGIRFEVTEELRNGDLLQIEIRIPHLHEPVQAVGEVVWCSHSGKEKTAAVREAGVRFRDMKPEDLNRILEYVYSIGIG